MSSEITKERESSDQWEQINRLFCHSTETAVQAVIQNADLVKMLLNNAPSLRSVDRKAFEEILQAVTNPYADQRCKPEYRIPEGWGPFDAVFQMGQLLEWYYPELDGSFVGKLSKQTLPDDTYFLQVVPKLYTLAKMNGVVDPYGRGYTELLRIMLKHIALARPFDNCLKLSIKPTPRQVRLLAHTRKMLEQLEFETPGDFLVIPMQGGWQFAGYSVQNARWEIQRSNQWALPAWVVGHHILIHGQRFSHESDLKIDCPGDEYCPYNTEEEYSPFLPDDYFHCSLQFYFFHEMLKLTEPWIGNFDANAGSASAVLPERN